MAQSVILKGAEIKTYISGKLFPEIQSITYTIDYNENEIFGIDSQFAQEIAPDKIMVSGTVNGVRVKLKGGLQGAEARVRVSQLLQSPYTALRLEDRATKRTLLWVPQMKVTRESVQIQAKGVVRFSFSFKGIIPYNPIDLDG